MAVSFIDGGNRSTLRKSSTSRKSLKNLYQVHLDWAGFELTTLLVIGTNWIGNCNYHTIMTTMIPNCHMKNSNKRLWYNTNISTNQNLNYPYQPCLHPPEKHTSNFSFNLYLCFLWGLKSETFNGPCWTEFNSWQKLTLWLFGPGELIVILSLV